MKTQENSEEKKLTKKVYPLMMRHMDLIWRRRFYGQFFAEGMLRRSYSEIEDKIFDQTLDFCEKYGFPGASECAAQIRHHIERNPDELERAKRLVSEGKLELEGGGETLIDTNMVCGESLYRNMYNGLSYYRDVFNSSSITAQCCDIFGLSAQLPQIFRQFGLYNVNNFSRVFKRHKPFWRGLDGSTICIHCVEDKADFCWVGYNGDVCKACNGEGCKACDYTGFDFTMTYNESNDKEHIEFLENYLGSHNEKEHLFMIENGEESLYPDRYPELYEKMAKKYGFEPVYDSYDKYFTDIFPADYEALKTGNIPEDKIDRRVEGNPVFCGCYTSRIKIKQYNRLLEDLLLTAETLATAADKADYPHRKLTDLWREMELLQFHDCITGSHSDAGYDELRTLCRDISRGTMKLVKQSASKLTKGDNGFTLFNVTDVNVKSSVLTAQIHVGDDVEFVDVFDDDGNAIPVASVKRDKMLFGQTMEIKLIGDIPAYSAKHFTYRKAVQKPFVDSGKGTEAHIENEYYRIGREGIFDKKLGRMVTRPGIIKLTDEIGDPWSKFEEETAFISLTGSNTSAKTDENVAEIVFEGTYSNETLGVRELKYKVTARLYNGVRGVYFNNEIDWDGENCHIYADFPLCFETKGKALYEIPFGTLERGFVDYQNDANSIADSYPAIGFVACRDRKNGYTVAVLNKGLPGYRVTNDEIWLSLLRSPTQDKHGGVWFDGAKEIGHHEFEYMLTTAEGTEDYSGDLVRQARFYNHSMITAKGEPIEKEMSLIPNVESDGNVMVTSARRTKEGFVQLRAFEPYGRKAEVKLKGFSETLPLEENTDNAVLKAESYIFTPYQIKTFTQDK